MVTVETCIAANPLMHIFAIGLEGGTYRPLFGMFRSSNTCCTALYCYARSALRWSISGFVGIMTWPSDTLAGTVVTPRRFRVLLRCWPVQPGADSASCCGARPSGASPWRVMFVRMGKGRVELTIPCRKGLAPCAR